VYCFQLAEKVTGWEANQWEKGAASYYLGEALEAAGDIPGAIAAYKRVLNCEQCGWHHASALGRLKVLESAGATQ
jgi:predicted TPR repeat methyltransferase